MLPMTDVLYFQFCYHCTRLPNEHSNKFNGWMDIGNMFDWQWMVSQMNHIPFDETFALMIEYGTVRISSAKYTFGIEVIREHFVRLWSFTLFQDSWSNWKEVGQRA